jgi:hypothetical protein
MRTFNLFNGETEKVPAGARVAIVSTQNEFGIVEYPEDKKVGIWAGGTHYTVDRPTA